MISTCSTITATTEPLASQKSKACLRIAPSLSRIGGLAETRAGSIGPSPQV